MIPKFRAWDKENKFMVTNFHRSHMEIETGKVLYQLTTTNENEIKAIASYNTFDDFTYRYSHDLKLMQSTGLKDKNGVEIFEGDVGWDAHFEEYGEVVFENGSFRYEFGNISEDLFEVTDDIEIVGNIYENPELLEQVDEN